MRICYISHADQHYVRSWVNYFARQGHDVHVVSLQGDEVPNATTHHPLQRSFNPMTDKWQYLFAPAKVRKTIKHIRPDLVHALYLTSNGVLGAMAGVHPLMVSGLGSDVYMAVKNPIKRRLVRWAMQRADSVNTVSRDLAAQVMSMGVPREKIFELTEGIQTERFLTERTSRRSGPARLICTRKLFPFYQCDVIVRALKKVADRGLDFEMRFAATGPQEDELRTLSTALGLEDRMTFCGGYSLEDLPPMLADADIYVSAAPWDGTSPALLEAMSAGAFPVVSDSVANLEWLDGKTDSMLFSAGDVDACGEQIASAIANESLRSDAVKPNQTLVLERGDRETNMQRFAAEYDRLVAAAK